MILFGSFGKALPAYVTVSIRALLINRLTDSYEKAAMKFYCLLLVFLSISCRSSLTERGLSSYEAMEAITIPKSKKLTLPVRRGLRDEKISQLTFDHGQKIIDFHDHSEVQRWMSFFQGRGKKTFARYLKRGARYRKMVMSLLKEKNLPAFLYYLAMMESGFSIRAKSKARAVGMWQFIKPTATRYGLAVNRYVDERQDPIRATLAAAEYMSDLYNVFGSWPLAMSAYNAGEARIMNLIMRYGTRDYWKPSKKPRFPKETASYVPKILAATILGGDPDRYGFKRPTQVEAPKVFSVELRSPLKLTSVARVTHTSLAQIKKLNPHILRGITPPNKKSYRLWIPLKKRHLKSKLSQLKPIQMRSKRKRSPRRGSGTYVVRKGDSLISIGRRFGLKVSTIKRASGLRGNRIYAGQKLKLPGRRTQVRIAQYRVKSGDSLSRVAKRFDMSLWKLKKMNSLRRSVIYPGQVLRVRRRG